MISVDPNFNFVDGRYKIDDIVIDDSDGICKKITDIKRVSTPVEHDVIILNESKDVVPGVITGIPLNYKVLKALGFKNIKDKIGRNTTSYGFINKVNETKIIYQISTAKLIIQPKGGQAIGCTLLVREVQALQHIEFEMHYPEGDKKIFMNDIIDFNVIRGQTF